MQTRFQQLIGPTLLAVIIILAAYLRLHRVEQTPGWYSDEGTHLAIARHLAEGRVQYFAISESVLLFGRPPLFELLLAGVVKVGGLYMSTLRMLTGLLGTLTVALMFGVVQALHGRRLAWLAAFLLAIYPQAVLFSRFGFSYNLLAPLVLLIFLSLTRFQQTAAARWLALAALSIGVGITADVFAGTLILPLLIVLVYRHRFALLRGKVWSALLCLLLIVAPFTLYVLVALATTPDAFLFDLQYTFTRLSGKSLLNQLSDLAFNYTVLLTQDFWLLAGLAGLFLLRQPAALLLLILPIAQLGRTVALHNLSAYYMIPMLPLIALGTARFVEQAAIYGYGHAKPHIGRWLALGLIAALLGTPFITLLSRTAQQVDNFYPTTIDPFLLNPADAKQVADYVNANTRETDTIIASPAIGWLFNAQVADFQMAVAVDGQTTPHLPANIPSERWAFDPRYEQARYVIIDNLWRNWGVLHNPPVEAMVARVEADWLLVFESGLIQVYEKPD